MTGLYKNKYRIPSARLTGWDYGNPGSYFITICTYNRECCFGQVRHAKMILSKIGKKACKYWQEIPDHFNNVQLGLFIIMPNHIHGILNLMNISGRDVACNVSTFPVPTENAMSKMSPKPGSLSTVIRSYKSALTNWAHQNHFPDFQWQTRFYDHIIRDESDYKRIEKYIINNPARWQDEKNQPDSPQSNI